jgi:hypothetical protein
MGITGFARLTGIHRDTVANWGKFRSGRLQEFPRWVPLLLDA